MAGKPLTPELSAKLKKEFPLFFLQMNDAQERFIRVKNKDGRTPRRRIFEAGNKVGKCLTYSTFIDTPNGSISVGELYDRGVSFDVYAWDGSGKVKAKASAPFKKDGLHKCYRITMSDGRWIEAADYHRILLEDGIYATVDSLYTYFQSLRESTWGASLSGLPLGAGRLFETRPGCQGDYLADYRPHDAPLHVVRDNVRASFPLQAGVRLRDAVLSHMGDSGNICKDICRLGLCHLSRVATLPRCVARFFGSLFRAVCMFFQQCIDEYLAFRQPCVVGVYLPQSCNEFGQSFLVESRESGTATCSLFSSPLMVDGNNIISIKPIKVMQEVYDFSVEKYHNYFAGGLVHHNTWIGIAEDLAYMMGFRPWLLPEDPDYKVDTEVPNMSMLGCETYKHSVAEKIEPAFRFLVPSTCQAKFKPGPTGVLNVLTLPFDCKGGKCGSELHIRSYDEQASSFEGQDYSGFIHWDEPPPEATWRAAERGKIVSNAPSWFTMTPLKEPWVYDRLSLRAAIYA